MGDQGIMEAMRRGRQVILIFLGIALLAVGTVCLDSNASGSSDSSVVRPDDDTVIDVDGNSYHTVTIGSQTWIVENLRVTHYRNGTAIPCVLNEEEWSELSAGAYCVPGYDSSASRRAYGLLYNFHAVEDTCGLCPTGWHVPTAAEWRTLIDYLGGVGSAGGKMKETKPGLWRIWVAGTTNESGFSAIPAGGRGRLGSAVDVGYYATWWSTESYDSAYAWHWGLYPDKNSVRFNPGHKSSGFSVRCLKDRDRSRDP